jgi:hypothetical protein
VGLCLVSACASGRSPQASFSLAPARELLQLDATSIKSGAVVYSLPEETESQPRVAFTARAWESVLGWLDAILTDRCVMRVELQLANGQSATPDPVCQAGQTSLTRPTSPTGQTR